MVYMQTQYHVFPLWPLYLIMDTFFPLCSTLSNYSRFSQGPTKTEEHRHKANGRERDRSTDKEKYRQTIRDRKTERERKLQKENYRKIVMKIEGQKESGGKREIERHL